MIILGQIRQFISAVLFLIIIMQFPSSEGRDECPKGFQLAPLPDKSIELLMSKNRSTPIEQYCYKLKGPEKLSDRYNNCDGNMFSFDLFMSLNLPMPRERMWTEYLSMYDGGFFVDWSHTNSTIRLLDWPKTPSNNVTPSKNVCVGFDPISNFTMMGCDSRNYRYCIVKLGSNVTIVERVSLTITVNSNTIKLFVNYTSGRGKVRRRLDMANIICYTDSVLYYPVRTTLEPLNEGLEFDVYTIPPMEYGYYRCTHSDPNFHKSISNRALYIDKSNVTDTYAVRIKTNDAYLLNNSEISNLLLRRWLPQLDQYLLHSSVYQPLGSKGYDDVTTADFNVTYIKSLRNFKYMSHYWLYKLKRLYLDGRTILLHVKPRARNNPIKSFQLVKTDRWNIFIEYIRPVYYCEKNFSLGMNDFLVDLKQYKCVGDFNNGVLKILTPQDILTTLPTKTPPQVPIMTLLSDVMGNDLLAMVIMKLESYLNNTDPVTVKDIEDIFIQINEILASSEELIIPGHFLHLLDEIGFKIDLKGRDDTFIVQNNIALVISNAKPHRPVKGLRIAVRETDTFIYDSFSIIRESNTCLLSTDVSEMVVSLPASVSTSNRRITFVVFRSDRALQGRVHNIVNSMVISVNVENITKFPPGEVIDIHHKPLIHQKRNQSRVCAYWRFNDDGTGIWSQAGCTFIRASKGLLDTCSCDHLTHFAEILIPHTVFSERNEIALEVISMIGCCVSILGLLIICLTAVLFHSWRRDFNNKIWLQMCISKLILSICFLVTVFSQLQKDSIVCTLVGVAVHYSVLSSFCWMLVTAVLSYKKLVLVFNQDAPHKLLRASVFAWGTPIVLLGILFSIAPNSYAGQYRANFSTGAFCYPSGLALWLAVYAPITVVILINWTIFMLIMCSVFVKPRFQHQANVNEAFRCASISSLLVFLFGLPWLFGIFSFNVVCAYFFTFFVTFQGFVLFFFFVLGNKNMRDLWLNKLKTKQNES